MSNPAERLANFPPLLQSALAILALELIDATEEDRDQAWAWAKAMSGNESIPPYVRTVMNYLSSVAGAVRAQAARNYLDRLGIADSSEE